LQAMFRKSIFFLLFALAVKPVMAQVQVADKIIGQVGNKIILQSDVDEMFNQQKSADANTSDTVKCEIFYNLMAQQILIEQASRDSVVVSDDEVEGTLDNRIRGMVQQYGSTEAFEEANGGRTVYQLKEQYRSFFKDKAIADKMQGTIMEKVKITPQEIDQFYKSLPKDSLPPFPASVEMGQIVITPKVDPEVDRLAKEKLEGIRKEIVENGKSFATMAGIYSMDGTRDNGGLMNINRKEVDQQFAAAAFRLQPGEISQVVRSKFGYHIIQMINRKGEEAELRHIIIVPEITNSDLQKTLKRLDSIRADLVAGKISFAEAVGKYSTDEQSKMTGGMVYDANGNSTLSIDGMDKDMAAATGQMKVGEYSQPQIFVDNPQTNSRATRILYMKNRTDPHILNLKDDYAKIQQGALSKKQNEYLNKWITERIGNYFIRIDENYQSCNAMKSWVKASAGTAGTK
jgi:peptidyl-prolyl cis-trans isomerase SurA